MNDACYLCRRTQVDLDHLNEEIRTRVYLSYFSQARGQLEQQQVRINFLRRLQEEEGGDAHFRIGVAQVFADPAAYRKLMPWIDTLLTIARAAPSAGGDAGTVGETVGRLLEYERGAAAKMEAGLNQIRAEFARGGRLPLTLESRTLEFPVDWGLDPLPFSWIPDAGGEREPLRRLPAGSGASVEVPIKICSVCARITERGPPSTPPPP